MYTSLLSFSYSLEEPSFRKRKNTPSLSIHNACLPHAHVERIWEQQMQQKQQKQQLSRWLHRDMHAPDGLCHAHACLRNMFCRTRNETAQGHGDTNLTPVVAREKRPSRVRLIGGQSNQLGDLVRHFQGFPTTPSSACRVLAANRN